MSKEDPTNRGCRISEIVQYTCDVIEYDSNPEVQCFPIPRIFRICPGKPYVEITRFVKIDTATGEVEIPNAARDTSVEGKPWQKITRRDSSRGQ